MSSSYFGDIWRHNISTFRRQPLAEISGSLGDLGTFLPIVIALTEGNQITLSSTLIFTGIFNILTGASFGIPLPVQPMKAIAAVAILNSLTAGETAAAGIFVAACILLFSITGLLQWFNRVIPIPVVKGIQVGAGLSLAIAAGSKILSNLSWVKPSWSDNYIWVIVAFTALLITLNWSRIPYALVVTVLGFVFAGIMMGQKHDHSPRFQLWRPHVHTPHGKEWKIGIVEAGIGQLPLTTLNSIIAVVALAADLLPEVTTPSVTAIGLSVAAMNLLGCWFGSMPVCHGSGGLAAQYRFGARSGASVIILGTIKLVLGLLFGGSLTTLLRRFPTAFLSVMVIAAGLELASVGESLNTDRARDVTKRDATQHLQEDTRKRRWTVMFVTAALLVAFKNDAIGFVAGMCCHWSYQISDGLHRRRPTLSSHRNESEDREALLPAA